MAELRVGEQAPNFTTKNDRGETVSLSDLRGKRVVLYFYPKDDTPGCTTQACGFRDQYPTITKRTPLCWASAPTTRRPTRPLRASSTFRSRCWSTATTRSRRRTTPGASASGTAPSSWGCCAATVIDEQGKIADAQYNVARRTARPSRSWEPDDRYLTLTLGAKNRWWSGRRRMHGIRARWRRRSPSISIPDIRGLTGAISEELLSWRRPRA